MYSPEYIIIVIIIKWSLGVLSLPALSHHPSLKSIALWRSSRLHIVFPESWCKSLLVGQHWHVHMQESLRKRRLWVGPCISCHTPYVLFVLLEWEADSRTAVVLWGVASRISSGQHAGFLCSFHEAFSLCILLVSIWCIHIVVWIFILLYEYTIWTLTLTLTLPGSSVGRTSY